jgi:hypothetical protein
MVERRSDEAAHALFGCTVKELRRPLLVDGAGERDSVRVCAGVGDGTWVGASVGDGW